MAASSISEVLSVRTNREQFYVKRYFRGGKRFRRFVGRSRVQGEWENLEFLKGLGIPCAPVVAFGLERRFGLFHRGALVLAEVPGATDLENHAKERGGPFADHRWRDAVSRQVAGYLRSMHEAHFIHSDFKWRNILATHESPPRVTLIDCPSGAVYPTAYYLNRRVKEIGRLDMLARIYLTRTERLRFFLRYRDHTRLTPDDRRLLRSVVSYGE